jgi:hypothetical protein
MLNLLLFAATAGTLGYLGLVALAFVFQGRMIYFPPRALNWLPSEDGMTFEDVWLETDDGVRLHGWFVSATPSEGVVLYFHGNASNIAGTANELAALQQMNLSALSLDYRGYGRSEGIPDEAGLYRDAAAAWRYLTEERGFAPNQIIIAGHSLGGGVAAWLAQQHTPAALVLMSTFTSMIDVGEEQYPILPIRLLSRNRYPTIERLPTIDAPVLITHGRQDRLIPFHHAQQLFAAAHEPKLLLELEGGHDQGLATALEQHPYAVIEFFAGALAP